MPSVTQIRTPTKRFLKSNFDWIRKLILSFFFIWNWNDQYVHTSKSIPDSRPKWVKSAPNGVKTSTIPSGAAHTYMGYIREYPARVVCERCPMVWPFIWKLFGSTFTGYYIFFSALWTVLNFFNFIFADFWVCKGHLAKNRDTTPQKNRLPLYSTTTTWNNNKSSLGKTWYSTHH